MSMETSGLLREQRIAEMYADDPQLRATEPLEAVSEAVRRPGLGLSEIIETVMQGYADRPALGHRAFEIVADHASGRRRRTLLPEFTTITYRELGERVDAIAAAWHHSPDHPVRPGDFVAMLGFTSGDYVALDLACAYLGAVSVPLQAGATASQLGAILDETGPRVLAATPELLPTAVDCVLQGDSIECLVVFDYHPEDDDEREAFDAARRRLTEAGSAVVLEPLATVVERGSSAPSVPRFAPEPGSDPLALLIYTSGSTGAPKGAMFPSTLTASSWRTTMNALEGGAVPTVGVSYLPMSHVLGRFSLYGMLARGGTAYFTASSDMSTLFEDIALVRPTEIIFVPRVCDMLFQRYQSELDRRSPTGEDRDEVGKQLREDLRQNSLGGRILSAAVSSAPLAGDIRTFMESMLDLELHDLYGSTESGGLLVDNKLRRPPVIDYKLIDVPELGYYLSDQPYPRGELLLKTEQMIPGYYRRPDVTAAMFDDDGFYRTGDVMAETGPDQLVYVDRRNNVMKLSQGEFVTISRLEAVYVASPLIQQVYVYGSSERSYLLAVIVPSTDALAAADGDEALKSAITESIQQIAKRIELNSYEIPRDFLIEREPFSTDNGLLSGVGKILRPKLKEHYGARLEQLYTDVEDSQANELLTLRRTVADRPVLETVTGAARALLGLAVADLRPDAHFTDLGGDSLSALSFSNLLNELFDVDVPVGVVVSAANTLHDLADYIEKERHASSERPTYRSVHGPDATEIRAGELTLDKFIDAHTLTAAPTLPAATAAADTVLLTGANGYLGRFLGLEWLERLSKSGGTLICLIRGTDNAAARKRLDEVFDSGDPTLVEHYRDLADRHLEVLAGDIAEPNFGLDEATWQRLAETVDLIVHPAALVNHVLPYDQLFGPNVVGTAEVIRLAVTARLKPVTYLSTVAVGDQVDPAAFEEDGDIRKISPARSINEGYANGYGNSKWAGEVLLREAYDHCGLPVRVFRSDMILAHSRYAGQLNVADMFTRLVLSVVAAGVAPFSFYETDPDGRRQRAHYDGIPVDFTAESIATIGSEFIEGFETFDVVNPHDDGISLDEVMDWLTESGNKIERIDDYRTWIAQFESTLLSLPDRQRQASVLPLLQAYSQPGRAIRGSVIPAERFQAAVHAAGIGPDGDIPHLSRSLIEKYVSDLRLRNLL